MSLQDDMQLISVDDHLIEHPRVWLDRMPARYQELCPQVVQSGDEGIAKSKTEQPDLILMDIIMPGTDGFKATRAITRDEATKHIPVIVCTSKKLETDRVWGIRQGAKDYIVKPVDANDLLAKIAALGIRIRNGCSYHGVALNVAMDLAPFAGIDPCGYAGLATVDLATLGVDLPWTEAAGRLSDRLAAHLNP